MQLIPVQLASNAVLIALILLYAIIDILAWSRNGIFVQELKALKDTSNERTFSEGEKRFSRLNPFIFMQYYLFFGLSLLTVIFPDAGHAADPSYHIGRHCLEARLLHRASPLLVPAPALHARLDKLHLRRTPTSHHPRAHLQINASACRTIHMGAVHSRCDMAIIVNNNRYFAHWHFHYHPTCFYF